jgi:hypothetical protein
MTKKVYITLQQLKDLSVSVYYLEAFEKTFGDKMEVTADNVISYRYFFDVGGPAKFLLCLSSWNEYYGLQLEAHASLRFPTNIDRARFEAARANAFVEVYLKQETSVNHTKPLWLRFLNTLLFCNR